MSLVCSFVVANLVRVADCFSRPLTFPGSRYRLARDDLSPERPLPENALLTQYNKIVSFLLIYPVICGGDKYMSDFICGSAVKVPDSGVLKRYLAMADRDTNEESLAV